MLNKSFENWKIGLSKENETGREFEVVENGKVKSIEICKIN